MLFEIAEAAAYPDHTVTITWSDGVRGVLDFLPIIDRGGWFTPLRDGDYFVSTMIALPAGAGLTWPEEIDYSADFLRQMAFPQGIVTAVELVQTRSCQTYISTWKPIFVHSWS